MVKSGTMSSFSKETKKGFSAKWTLKNNLLIFTLNKRFIEFKTKEMEEKDPIPHNNMCTISEISFYLINSLSEIEGSVKNWLSFYDTELLEFMDEQIKALYSLPVKKDDIQNNIENISTNITDKDKLN